MCVLVVRETSDQHRTQQRLPIQHDDDDEVDDDDDVDADYGDRDGDVDNVGGEGDHADDGDDEDDDHDFDHDHRHDGYAMGEREGHSCRLERRGRLGVDQVWARCRPGVDQATYHSMSIGLHLVCPWPTLGLHLAHTWPTPCWCLVPSSPPASPSQSPTWSTARLQLIVHSECLVVALAPTFVDRGKCTDHHGSNHGDRAWRTHFGLWL